MYFDEVNSMEFNVYNYCVYECVFNICLVLVQFFFFFYKIIKNNKIDAWLIKTKKIALFIIHFFLQLTKYY